MRSSPTDRSRIVNPLKWFHSLLIALPVRAQISGNFTKAQAFALGATVQYGPLPVSFTFTTLP